MARVCRRQQCSVERRGFRQELDSWRHKLIHCVGETLSRQPSALGPPHCRPPRRREGGSRDRAIAAPARPPSLAWRPPPPPPGVRARATSGRALPARARARAPAPPLRAPFPGRALGRERVPLLSSLSLPPSLHPCLAARRRRRLIVETRPAPLPLEQERRSRWSRKADRGSQGRAGPPLGLPLRSGRRLPRPTQPLPHARPRRAPLSPRARAAGGRAPGARACAKREVEMGAEGTGAVTGPGSA